MPDFLAERMLTSKGGNSYRQAFALVIVQIIAVYFWGVEPNQRSLKELEQETGGPSGGVPRPVKI